MKKFLRKLIEPRTIGFLIAVVVAVYALSLASHANHVASQAIHEVRVEEKARVQASCAASTQSRTEIVKTFKSLTDLFRTPLTPPASLRDLDAIDAQVKKDLGGPSPLCKVPGAK